MRATLPADRGGPIRRRPLTGDRRCRGRRHARPSAAAPTSGAVGAETAGRRPVSPGEVEAGARRSISAWAAAKNGSPNPSATDPATTARRRSSRLATDATARPTSVPVRATTSGRASAAGRPVMAAMAVPDASASRQPRRAARAQAAVGLDDHVADVAGVAAGAVEQPAVEHDAAADAGGHDHGQEVATAPRAAPTQPSPSASALASLSTNTGSPVSSASRARSGKSRHAGMFSGDTALAARRHRPAAPDAAHDRCDAGVGTATPLDQVDERGEQGLGVGARGVGTGPGRGSAPSRSTTPAASFVPPMSTASTDPPRRP